MPEEQFKRSIAYKLRIGEILTGKPIMENERFSYLDLNGLKVRRVNVVGSVVEKYENEGEKRFIFVKIDDGSGQISLKLFGDDIPKLKDLQVGETIIVIGGTRFFNNEIYLAPETISVQNPKYLLVRKMEIEKSPKIIPAKIETAQTPITSSLKDKIIEVIKNSEPTGGIEIAKIPTQANESFDKVNKEVQKLIEEGYVFEPRPGVVRWLG